MWHTELDKVGGETLTNAHSMVRPEDRIDFERRRVFAVRALFLLVPIIMWAEWGAIAIPQIIVTSICVVGSNLFVWLALTRWPGAVARYQLLLRLMDVALVSVGLFNIHTLELAQANIPSAAFDYFDAFYVMGVSAATATHGWRGGSFLSIACVMAIFVGRYELAQQGYIAFSWARTLGTVGGYGLLFFETTLLVSAVMETSGDSAARRERALGAEVAARNATLEETAAQLRLANDQLTRLDEMKGAFLSNVSHELRTPVTSIRAFAEFLLDRDLDAATRQEFTTIIQSEAERLTRLVNNVLDLTRIQSESVAWQVGPLDLRKVLDQVLNALRPLANEKQLELIADVDENFPWVVADPDGLRQVLLNLVGNAIKFTHDGIVRVSATVVGATAQVAVIDSGPGIALEDQPRIFDRFYQTGNILTSKPGGTGLGLTITREILAQHGTTLDIRSELGKGSTFSFGLPLGSLVASRVIPAAQS